MTASRRPRIRESATFPVRLPVIDIHTVGAGGGSIAFVDSGGALRVGPQVSRSVPGPVCYGVGTNSRSPTPIFCWPSRSGVLSSAGG
jgi:N-methylhydantoinase A/oxoprolinase/acetone carboxylase beta subunit